MDAKLWCSAGSTTSEGKFMWEYEQSSVFEKVVVKDGSNSSLQEWFREKRYDKDKATGILGNNLTKNEKFFGRVNITSDGSLIVMNSTVQDSGNYKCSYKGITGPVKESLIQLTVRPLKAAFTGDKYVEITNKPTLQISEATSGRTMEATSNRASATNGRTMEATSTRTPVNSGKTVEATCNPNPDNSQELHRYKVVVIILVVLLVLLVVVFLGYTFHKKLNNRRADEGRAQIV